ncbi:MAG: ammonia-forming cytochrome c nitrite reductase subunit c552 [Anaerolinea sp.]|nr:ammonia-forming cytochrome c nitrite reductase subunit c552 [Anaerolinea sp.]
MTTPTKPNGRSLTLIGAAFVLGLVVMAGLAALLTNIQQRKAETVEYPLRVVNIDPDELDPAVWGQNFPRQYDAFLRTEDDTISTPYGGSIPYSKLEKYPAMVRIWAGYAFSKDHNEERGHFYTTIDQKNTLRVQIVDQPGACINCHAAEAPQLIAEMGWEQFNSTPYNDLKDKLHVGSSCADCHDPVTMALRITRPALVNALDAQGIDWTQASRQEMRTYVCAQCHVEYYFLGDDKVLTFPWSQGYNIDDIANHYDQYGFKDWTHAETNAPMIKIQHPEFELWNTGLHAQSGVSCADCHMPYVREGAVKISDHHLRSPLTNVNQACQTCHKQDEALLTERILTIQNRTAQLLRLSEDAIIDAIDAIVAAQEAGATDEQLEEARYLHRQASLRWDFISSENSTGFHSPQEAARVLALSIDYARQAQLAAERVTASMVSTPVGN